MTASEYIELRQKCLDEYEKLVMSRIKSSDSISVLIAGTSIEGFLKGFDEAFKHFDPKPQQDTKEKP